MSIAIAILFLLVLFIVKNGLPWRYNDSFKGTGITDGLRYENALVADVVKRDTDGDRVLDWEEGLWGLDPTKVETTPGIPDITIADKFRVTSSDEGDSTSPDLYEENLSETDKFSRELFSTVTSLNQSGALDAATLDNISQSLADKIKNSVPRKEYTLADLRMTNDESSAAVRQYSDALERIYTKYPVAGKPIDIMQKFIIDEETVDESALAELDPLVERMGTIISEVLKVSVPRSLAPLHLDTLNALERIRENLSDMRALTQDPLVALVGVNQYDRNVTSLGTASDTLKRAIAEKLKY